jgi:hypothetical protein
LLLDLFGEFQRVVVACALDVEPAEQELRFQQVGLGAQGVLQRLAGIGGLFGADLGRGQLGQGAAGLAD